MLTKLQKVLEPLLEKHPYRYGQSFTEWLEEINEQLYIDMFKPIMVNNNGYLCLFKYDNLTEIGNDYGYGDFWTMYNGLYRELRAIVIDMSKNELVIYPFEKFFNVNELPETSTDVINEKLKNAKTIEFTDKLDGSLQCARWYEGELVMCGSQAINAEQSWRLDDGYKRLKNDTQLYEAVKNNPEYTFMFEYITLQDAHVVVYRQEDEGLYLIGMRDMNDGRLLHYHEVLQFAKNNNIRLTTEIFKDRTFNDVMNSLDDKKSDEKEGFVLNIDGFRAKIKYNDYCQIHKILSKLSSINLIIKFYADGNIDDLISHVPQNYHARIMDVVNVLAEYVHNIHHIVDSAYENVKDMDIRFVHQWMNDNNIPQQCQGYVFTKLKGKPYNPLKRGANGYKKMNDLKDYLNNVKLDIMD